MSQPPNNTNINYDDADVDVVFHNEDSTSRIGKVNIECQAKSMDNANLRRQVLNVFFNRGANSEILDINVTIAKPLVGPPAVGQVIKNADSLPSSGYASQRSVFDQVDAPSSPFLTFGTPPLPPKDKIFSIGIEPDKSFPQSQQSSGDVSFVVSGQVFHAMRMLLSEKSPVFEELFQRYPAYRYKVTNQSIDPVVFEAMLCFLSNKNALTQLNQHQTAGLLQVSSKFELNALKGACEQSLIDSKCADNALDLLILAKDCQARNLKESLIDFIAIQCPLICQSDAFVQLAISDPTLFREVNGRIIGTANRIS